MANKRDKSNIRDERIEDGTAYGEYVASLHQWNTPDRQRRIARHLEEVTDEAAPDTADKTREIITDKKRSN